MLHYYQDSWVRSSRDRLHGDICIYGGTAAGVIAAVTAAQLGKKAILLHPGRVFGGMTTGGLGWTDIGMEAAIGGLAREFYRIIGRIYGGAYGKGEIAWRFEPSTAQKAIDYLIDFYKIEVYTGTYLDSVELNGAGKITTLRLRGGMQVQAAQYIDTSYEGDLVATAGVPYTTGREDRFTHKETLNGFQLSKKHQFTHDIDPYVEAGAADSGLLAGLEAAEVISSEDLPKRSGQGSRLIQAYCFRVCMTNQADNRIPFPQPERYRSHEYELVARWLSTIKDRDEVFHKFEQVVPGKTDTNNWGPVSTDFIGGSSRWPDAGYEEREEIFQAHVRYQMGLHYYMANDRKVPDFIRREYAQWGLAKDEFLETGGWPHQLYVREARRMQSDYTVTEQDCLGERSCSDPVGMGAYMMDSHNCQRIILDGKVKNEGDVQVHLPGPYGISYRAIIPPKGSVGNLLAPLSVSASHIAFGSIRMEPVFMILAESAAAAACIAVDSDCNVQSVEYKLLAEILKQRNQLTGPRQL